MKPIAVFYHCWSGGCLATIMPEQMHALKLSGLMDAASEFHIVHNDGGDIATARSMTPPQASFHDAGRSELGEGPTLSFIHQWVKIHPDWSVCYFHPKGCSHGDSTIRWRHCMEISVIWKWRECVRALESADSCGAHWMTNSSGQKFWGGNFWWANSNYLIRLPPPFQNNRWWAELWISNVTVSPKVIELAGHPTGQCL